MSTSADVMLELMKSQLEVGRQYIQFWERVRLEFSKLQDIPPFMMNLVDDHLEQSKRVFHIGYSFGGPSIHLQYPEYLEFHRLAVYGGRAAAIKWLIDCGCPSEQANEIYEYERKKRDGFSNQFFSEEPVANFPG